jgi:hypothetical protein
MGKVEVSDRNMNYQAHPADISGNGKKHAQIREA